MKIGILATAIGNFGEKGVYNSQEVGLAKALSAGWESVLVYKLTPMDQKECIKKVEGYKNVQVHFLPSKQWGVNGLIDLKKIDSSLDVLIYFSDTQIALPKVYRWAKKNSIGFFPYIGVLESHSTSKVKRGIINFLSRRNLSIYRKVHCLAKTPHVEKQLRKYGVSKTTICPVGLDTSLLNPEMGEASLLKEKYGYEKKDRVILFIGRMIEEKQPLKMIKVFSRLVKKDENYKLLMIGKGELQSRVREEVQKRNLSSRVTMIDVMPNRDVQELYQFADAFVNLNEQEIFGMAVLEAMYYNCKVIAMKAPGPNFIIEQGVSGWLVAGEKEIIEKMEAPLQEQGPHNRIISHFTWNYTAKMIERLLNLGSS